MRAGFGNFRFQGLVPSLELRKVRLYGHVGGFSSVRLLPDPRDCTPFCPIFEVGSACAAQQSPICVMFQSAALKTRGQKGILFLEVLG
jgi:hypothetical protein